MRPVDIQTIGEELAIKWDDGNESFVRLEVLRAPRGAIYDRHGELLADSAPSFTILFRPFPAESAQRIHETRTVEWISRVSALTGLDSAQVRRHVTQANASGQSEVLRRNSPFEVLAEECRRSLDGLSERGGTICFTRTSSNSTVPAPRYA